MDAHGHDMTFPQPSRFHPGEGRAITCKTRKRILRCYFRPKNHGLDPSHSYKLSHYRTRTHKGALLHIGKWLYWGFWNFAQMLWVIDELHYVFLFARIPSGLGRPFISEWITRMILSKTQIVTVSRYVFSIFKTHFTSWAMGRVQMMKRIGTRNYVAVLQCHIPHSILYTGRLWIQPSKIGTVTKLYFFTIFQR